MNLLHLLHICDPSLPIGGFAHSSGLETYVQQGTVRCKNSATTFVTQQLSNNIGYTDAAILSLSYDAANNNDIADLLYLDELCTAVKLPMETRTASNKLGMRLLKIFQNRETFHNVQNYSVEVREGDAAGHYCIAFGIIAQALNIGKKDALSGFLYNAAAGLVMNAVKLVPLGQDEGQKLLMSLFPLINTIVEQGLVPDKKMIGLSNAGFDIRCMQHEQLESRLYMS